MWLHDRNLFYDYNCFLSQQGARAPLHAADIKLLGIKELLFNAG